MVNINLDASITAQGRYEKLAGDRKPFLDRARECAALTKPALVPPQGFSKTQRLPVPYQSLGARGVRTLASKLLLSLYPSIPFFNYHVDDVLLQQLGAARGDVEMGLASRERSTMTEVNSSVFRPIAFTATEHLVVAGNFLTLIPSAQSEKAQGWRLDQFVTRRDAKGNLLEIVIHEATDYSALDLDVRKTIFAAAQKEKKGDEKGIIKSLEERPVDLYTHCYWEPVAQQWFVYQEAKGIRIPSTFGSYNPADFPYQALRFSSQPGEQYGRGYVEECLGDLDSLEALSESLVKGTAAGARVVFFVNPAGTTSLSVVRDADTGDVVAGNAEDVTVLQVQKQADLQTAKSQAEEIAARLAYAFLLHSAVQRKGERVTAEEIRFMAQELDDGLGGVYTHLAADWQLPSVRLFERRMEKRIKVTPLPKDIQPVIVAGLEAIGRGHDQANLRAFVKDIFETLTPPIAIRFIHGDEIIRRSAASYSIDPMGLIKTPDEIAQAEQQDQMQSLVQTLGPNAVKAAGDLANNQAGAQ